MNKYSGGNFDDFLKEEGIFEEVSERTRKRVIALEIEGMVNAAKQNKTTFFEKINTDLVELNHFLFDLENTVITSELLKSFTLEAKEMKIDPVKFNDPLFESEELLNRLLTEEIAA
ncbi:MAG: Fis family transcriptional regulator [Candidatus Poribacteria bacterium]|nr:Fis family transcriptional regulator [Candidatus Poribacteria bacterium]